MQKSYLLLLLFFLLSCLAFPVACEKDDESDDDAPSDDSDDDSGDDDDNNDNNDNDSIQADVLAVSTFGEAGEYIFSVTISSPDTGCDQYADWWEVLSNNGNLIYRRILNHSHVDEQPFTREGGPVPVQPDDIVIVRAHMNEAGYSGAAKRGSINYGFADAPDITSDFAKEVESQEPLPDDCLY